MISSVISQIYDYYLTVSQSQVNNNVQMWGEGCRCVGNTNHSRELISKCFYPKHSTVHLPLAHATIHPSANQHAARLSIYLLTFNKAVGSDPVNDAFKAFLHFRNESTHNFRCMSPSSQVLLVSPRSMNPDLSTAQDEGLNPSSWSSLGENERLFVTQKTFVSIPR